MAQEKQRNSGAEGLTDAQVAAARERYGSNRLTRQKGISFLRRFFGNMRDPVIRILLAALGVNLLLALRNGEWVETLGIAAAILLATLISTLSEHSSANAFDRLSERFGGAVCRVRRAGQVREISPDDVVVGDRVLLSSGESIPADGLLRSGSLTSDQSALTGESCEVEKQPTSAPPAALTPSDTGALFRGCTVTYGSGEMEVTAVGDSSFLGQISREVQAERRESPLKLRLAKLARQISVMGYLAAALVAIAYLFHVFLLDSGMRWEILSLKLTNLPYLLSKLLHALTLGLTVIVVAVPEGLPMMIAVVLSANMKRMIRDNVLVKNPAGIEAAGSMNLLFTDKTGTLTEGKMKVESLLLADGRRFSSPSELRQVSPACAELVGLGLRGGEAVLDESHRALGGNATDRALLEAVAAMPISKEFTKLSALPFDSGRKYAAVTYRGKQEITLLVGAPERLLPHASHAYAADGSRRPLRASEWQALTHSITSEGGRCLALAVSANGQRANAYRAEVRGDLILVCLIGLRDPIRSTAASTVSELQGAGIDVVMITGDGRETAASICRACGLLTKKRDLILTGEELARLSDARLRELLPRLAAVARSLPTDKSRLVRLSQELGAVVGMTGDGINDAPALRKADVGFAMGSGTHVAKEAGDIIILDDNLASISRAVLYGRTVFKSIRKFIALQLVMNFSAVGVTVICPFLGVDSPVTVVQMLWINLIMDTLGGLAFAGEAPLPDYMKERPKRREEGILNRYMANEIFFLGGFTVALCLLFLKSPFIISHFRPHEHNLYLLTAFFALFIFSSVFNCFNARTDRLKLTAGLGRNPVFLLIMAAVLVIQLIFVYVGGSILRTAPLTLSELSFTMLLSLTVFPFDLLRKLILRKIKRRGGY
ncbi:MAG: calcium-translocating P-type ATPase, PMCA-type [Ruminococcaceae bacterium]|nr:calcium-translocating P-type ATPase, PMCA-type [Oscillospiraceae bacterium]